MIAIVVIGISVLGLIGVITHARRFDHDRDIECRNFLQNVIAKESMEKFEEFGKSRFIKMTGNIHIQISYLKEGNRLNIYRDGAYIFNLTPSQCKASLAYLHTALGIKPVEEGKSLTEVRREEALEEYK